MQAHLLPLLHLSDPTLPIGGYTHSNGLETYVQEGLVHDAASAAAYIQSMLVNNLQYNDAAFASLAYDAAVQEDFPALLQLDEECTALKIPREIRQASQKLGSRLLKIFSRRYPSAFVQQYEQAIQQGDAAGHYCLVFGVYACQLQAPKADALQAFYYNAAVGMVTNSVKLVPLGQLDGQDILFRLQPLMQELATATLQPDRRRLGCCNPGLDIRCMQHERLYSRLYMS
ncbi:urease accessory protein UreF [Chitinophaga japonensis]|uniref:Urease accessory protein UreF n=1 Tax=Chitinophaga japonensis TaxID=104662 RepID=A0A562SZW2_CHIJA|nr:urease accessory protein UreF [Chitinophaga japonensis]TWI86544.1 urease accessory protein [Chitinophaga japonensis]